MRSHNPKTFELNPEPTRNHFSSLSYPYLKKVRTCTRRKENPLPVSKPIQRE